MKYQQTNSSPIDEQMTNDEKAVSSTILCSYLEFYLIKYNSGYEPKSTTVSRHLCDVSSSHPHFLDLQPTVR